MAILLSSKTVRVPVNVGSSGDFTDQLTRAAVKFPIADLRIEALFRFGPTNGTQQLVDLSNWVSVTCTFKALVNNAAPGGDAPNLAQKVVLAAALNPSATVEQWDALTHQHAAFGFTEAEINNIAVGKVWCVITALLDTGIVLPLQFGTMEAVQDGYASAGTTQAAENTAYTKEESLALFGGTYNTITARTGGGATAIDGLVTVATIATGTSIRTCSGAGGGREEWVLRAGTDAEDADAGIVRPDDYDSDTNARVWKQIL